MLHLYNHGIKGHLWHLFDSLHTDITSVIKWNGEISTPLIELQGIRQGAISSTGSYKARTDPSLDNLERHSDNLHIGYIPVGAIMVADDLMLASNTKTGIQNLVTEAELDASREQFSFSKTKTKSIIIGPKKIIQTATADVKLYGSTLETTKEETHLGITRTNDQSNTKTIEKRKSTARRTSFSLMGARLHGLVGVGPEVGKHIYQTYITPKLLHGLEAIILTNPEIKELEEFYRCHLRYIQHLPKSTATPLLYLLLGVPPIEAQIHIRTLNILHTMISRTDSVEFKLVERQLAMKEHTSNSWVWQSQNLLNIYKLRSAFKLLNHTIPKEKWKRMVKASVLKWWEDCLKNQASCMKTTHMVNLERCCLSRIRPVWDIGGADSLTTLKANTKAKLLVQRYPLYYSRTAGTNYGKPCPLCKYHEESIEHFILDCHVLEEARSPLLRKIQELLVSMNIQPPDDMVKFILDPSHHVPEITTKLFERYTRDLCFKLHQYRSTSLGYSTRYKKPNDSASVLLFRQNHKYRHSSGAAI